MNPFGAVPCPRCGALAGIVIYIAGGSGQHQAICQRAAGGCGLHLPRVATSVEAEADWLRRSVGAAIRRERAQQRRNRYGWARDPVIVADICEHYVGYQNGLIPDYRCRVMWAPHEGDPRRQMNVQAFVYVYLAPRYGFVPTPNDEARVNRILHLNGFPIAEQPEKAFTGRYAGAHHPKRAVIAGKEPYDVT